MKLLLAEDDSELSNTLVRVLNYQHYTVDAVHDGETALSLLSVNSYDAVILDVMMPRRDGISVAREVRARNNPVPILMLTARAEIDDRVTGLDAGADDYLTKPFAIKELLARIRALTRRSGVAEESYQIGNTTLNPATFELSAVGTVRLTNKEYRLMEHLIRNQNVLLSTERLLESVWEYNTDAEINVVWVFLSNLRKKLDAIGSDHIIHAVRGVGYRLEERHD